MGSMRHLEQGEKYVLAQHVYNTLIKTVESLELDDMMGPDLAYLLGAILNGTVVEWPADRQIMIALHNLFDVNHAVWNYVQEEVIL